MGCRLLGVTFIDVWKILRAFQEGILPYMVFIGFLSFSIPNPIGLARFSPKTPKGSDFSIFLTVFIKMMKNLSNAKPKRVLTAQKDQFLIKNSPKLKTAILIKTKVLYCQRQNNQFFCPFCKHFT